MPTLTLGTSGLILRGLDPLDVVSAAAANGFAAIDVSTSWGDLGWIRCSTLPIVVRVPPRGSWPLGCAPAVDDAYSRADVLDAVARAGVCGEIQRAVLHKWDPSWSGDSVQAHIASLAVALPGGVGLGVACPDSDPAAALDVSPSLEAVSVQYNLANRRAATPGPTYARACRVEARAPLDAGSVLPGFFDGLAPTDVRRRIFEPFGAPVRACSTALADVASSSGLAPAEVALRWVLRHDWIVEICVGATSVPQVESLAGALDAGPLPDELTAGLDYVDWSWRYGR